MVYIGAFTVKKPKISRDLVQVSRTEIGLEGSISMPSEPAVPARQLPACSQSAASRYCGLGGARIRNGRSQRSARVIATGMRAAQNEIGLSGLLGHP